MKRLLKKSQLQIMALLITAVPVVLQINTVLSLSMFNKTITVGSSAPSVVTNHRYSFNVPSSANVGSMEFEYCTNTPFVGQPCTAPAGVNVSAAAIASQSGITGYIVHGNTTSNRLVITRAASVVGPVFAQYNFTNITNPSNIETTIYVRMATYASVDGTGPRTDEGAVVFSTSGGLGATGFVPPYMTFCVGVTVALNCSATSGSFIDVGQLSSTQTKATTTQFAVATNDPEGYTVYTLGTTMTSGTNIITPLSFPQASNTGSSQFGVNLRDNSYPDIGEEKIGAGSGNPFANYNNPNLYKYLNGDSIAGGIDSTDFNRYTVSYIINVSDSQPAGRYNTTITYLALASF
jgi:hypothetical protein